MYFLLVLRSNFSDSETKSILDKHGIEPQTKVHEDEAKYMFSDILDNLHSILKLFLFINFLLRSLYNMTNVLCTVKF